MKKAFSLLLLSFVLLVAVLSLSSCGVLLKKTGFYDGYEYHVDSEYEITLTGYKGDKTKLEIPSWLDGYKVVGIAFDENDKTLEKIESIKIPKTILSISSDTFLPCKNLKQIKVALDNPKYKYFHDSLYTKDGKTLICYPQGKEDAELILHKRVTKIADRAFLNARHLKKVTFSGTEKIGQSAFIGCVSLETVDFGPKMKEIGVSAFEGCPLLNSVAIPDTVERIEASAFKNCNALTSFSIGNGIKHLGTEALGNLDAITTQNEFSGAYYLGNAKNPYAMLIRVQSKTETEYIVHPETKAIYESAFEGCENLESIELPNSLSCIGKRAFYNCKKLVNPVIPEFVNKIEDYSFYGCISITEIILPSSVSAVGDSAFEGCTALSSITLSNRTKLIGSMAFAECTSLTQIEIPEVLSYIGNSAFSGCTALGTVAIPKSVSYIGKKAFAGCTHLNTVIFADTENWTMCEKTIELQTLSDPATAAFVLTLQLEAMIKLQSDDALEE